MGFFDSLSDNNKLFIRMDDKPGTTIQRFDSIKVETSRKGVEYLKFYKTIIRVIDGEEPKVGDEATHVIWPDADGFAEKDLRNMFRALFDLSVEEANDLTIKKIQSYLIPLPTKKEPNPVGAVTGMLFEQTARQVLTSNDKLVVNVHFTREVDPSELTEAEAERFYPGGRDN